MDEVGIKEFLHGDERRFLARRDPAQWEGATGGWKNIKSDSCRDLHPEKKPESV